MFDGMEDVAIGTAMLTGRRVDLHRSIVIRMQIERQPDCQRHLESESRRDLDRHVEGTVPVDR